METVNNTYEDLLKDASLRMAAEKLVMRAGISMKFKGSAALADTIILYGTDYSRKFGVIYEAVSAYRGLKVKTLMREIGYAISQSRELAVRLSVMLGITVRDDELHSGLVISYLGMIFKNPELSLYT